MKKALFLFACVAVVFTGCATTIITRSAYQKNNQGEDQKKTIDAITYAISENGFEVAMLNERYGLINTNWRKVTSGADTTMSVLSALSSRGSTSSYSRALSLSFKLDAFGYKVTPKLKKITTTRSGFSSGSTDEIEYPKENSAEGKLTVKIIREINIALGIDDDFEWTEKEIKIGAEEEEPIP